MRTLRGLMATGGVIMFLLLCACGKDARDPAPVQPGIPCLTPKLLHEEEGSADFMAVADGNIYWSSNARLKMMPVDGSKARSTLAQTGFAAVILAGGNGLAYWQDATEIVAVTPEAELAGVTPMPFHMADLFVMGKYLYGVEHRCGKFARFNRDLTQVDLAAPPLPPIWLAGKTYLRGTEGRLACGSVDLVEVMDSWGEPQRVVVRGIEDLRAIATDAEFIYWADLVNNQSHSQIWRVRWDGSDKEKIYEDGALNGIRDLALASDRKFLYFGEHLRLGKMLRIDLVTRETRVIHEDLGHFAGPVYHDGGLYWLSNRLATGTQVYAMELCEE